MEYVIAGIVGYAVGYWFRGIMVLYHLSRDPDRIITLLKEIKKVNEREEAEGQDNTQGTELFIERVNNHLYAYVKDTNQFIAQGPDLKSLLDEAHKRFPNKQFFGNIAADNPAKELV